MNLIPRWLLIVAACGALWPSLAPAQQSPASAPSKDLIAVMDLEAIGANKVEATAMTDRLREELLKGGRFTLVDRSQMEAVLAEQALQQAGCTSQECAVKVGKTLGVRKIIVGRVTKVSENIWQVSAQLIDVETSETQRAESIRHRGDFFTLLDRTIVELAQKLGQGIAVAAAPVPKPAGPAAAEPQDGEKPRRGWYLGAGAAVQNVTASALNGKTALVSTNGDSAILLGALEPSGSGVSLVGGYRFNPISVEYLYSTSNHSATHDFGSSTAKATVTEGIFDVRYSFPVSAKWEAFGLAGLGVYSVEYDTFGLTGANLGTNSPRIDQRQTATLSGSGISLGAGAEYFRGSLLVRLAAVYHAATLTTAKVGSMSEASLKDSIDLKVANFSADLAYRF